MVRDHRHDYARGPGYSDAGGVITEQYWVATGEVRAQAGSRMLTLLQPPALTRRVTQAVTAKLPYRIELIGVTCNASLAVARGIWRKLRTGRGVPIRAQLRSFKLFARNWELLCRLVDSATLYHTGARAEDQKGQPFLSLPFRRPTHPNNPSIPKP